MRISGFFLAVAGRGLSFFKAKTGQISEDQGTTCTLPGSEHFCDFPQRDTPCGGFYYLPFKEKVTQVGGVDPLSGFLDSRNPQRFDESGQGSVSLSSAGTAFCDFPQRDTPCGGFLLRFLYGFAEFLWVVGAIQLFDSNSVPTLLEQIPS